ncbi:hypothetical protein [Maledivibacter halophilus]|uniref:Uncharacterized protein n=1 Tax=Maledivibacter halophilus TaxID=36842 RepID=A0A1T5M9H2_9FIRM|nr:hypothetical protein [Maledivibacter halophilus]SKC84785.1 hypothetical protein SAMN02194393_04216 [Maledivibacter halophilus]
MIGYLLLEDGSLYESKILSDTKNILGNIVLNKEGTIILKCNITGNSGLIVNGSNHNNGDISLGSIDFQNLKSKIEKNNMLNGKIVTDSLPIEYHMYDLKTFIPAH